MLCEASTGEGRCYPVATSHRLKKKLLYLIAEGSNSMLRGDGVEREKKDLDAEGGRVSQGDDWSLRGAPSPALTCRWCHTPMFLYYSLLTFLIWKLERRSATSFCAPMRLRRPLQLSEGKGEKGIPEKGNRVHY